MASKSVLMNAMFDQFISFVNELIEMYPEDADFSVFLTSLKMLKMTNPSLLSKYVYENTASFEEQILSKNEKFFVDYSFSEYSTNVDLNIFSKLKQYISTMNEESKNSVWKYIQNIYRLSKAISTV